MASSAVAVQTAFSYASLAPDTRATVEAATDRLHILERKTGEQIIEIGKLLIQVKASLGHGLFGAWIDAEFGWSERAAQNFMAVADRFKSANYADLNVAPSALYVLASNSIPEEVRIEFTELAAAGHKVTHKDVKARLAQIEAEPDGDDDEPLSDYPYERVDPYTGEVIPHDAPPARIVLPKPTPERRPSEPQQDMDARANVVAADLVARHGADQAARIAFAILAQTGQRP